MSQPTANSFPLAQFSWCAALTETIPSIRKLYATIGSHEYESDDEAAAYYAERLHSMLGLWERFEHTRRTGVSHDALTSDPDRQLARIGQQLGLNPPLMNEYRHSEVAAEAGVGDPLSSHKFDRIVAANKATTVSERQRLALMPERIAELDSLYARCLATFGQVMTFLFTASCDVVTLISTSCCDALTFL